MLTVLGVTGYIFPNIFRIFWTFSTLVISTFYAFSAMFSTSFNMFISIYMANSLSNLILVILSLQTDFTFLLFSFPLFSDHTLGDKTNEVIMIGAHRPDNKESPKDLSTRRLPLMSPQEPIDLIGLLILIGIDLGPLLLIGPADSKSLPSLFLITGRLS